jgi:NAD-dependent dihydropyrimidine dehydrogenase PreA subunit
MIANYGYKDGSGDYFIAIDTDKCNGCMDCVKACPYGVLDVGPDENDPLSDDEVAFVTEMERKKIKYTCAPCKPMANRPPLPCIAACKQEAISHSW